MCLMISEILFVGRFASHGVALSAHRSSERGTMTHLSAVRDLFFLFAIMTSSVSCRTVNIEYGRTQFSTAHW